MKNYYIIEYDDGHLFLCDRTVREPWQSAWSFFDEVAVHIAMSDCTNENVPRIVYDHKEYRYTGWMPGMHFIFENVEDPDDSYSVWLPEYEH